MTKQETIKRLQKELRLARKVIEEVADILDLGYTNYNELQEAFNKYIQYLVVCKIQDGKK